MKKTSRHGGKRPGAGRKPKWDQSFLAKVVVTCDELFEETAKNFQISEKKRLIEHETELEHLWSRVNAIPISRRKEFLSSDVYEIHSEYIDAEIDLLASDKKLNRNVLVSGRLMSIDGKPPHGTIQKIINAVAKQYSLKPKEVENAWGAHRRKNINKT